MKARGLFVTGTDTGVGKTLVTGLLAAALRAQGVDVGVMKPFETGCPIEAGRLMPQDALYLRNMAGAEDELELVCPYRLRDPLAPGVAAEREGVSVDLRVVRAAYEELARRHRFLLVESAGGLLVPISDQLLTPHLIKLLDLPVLVVARGRLGTVNHTLLTVNEARRWKLEVAGVILSHSEPQSDLSAESNARVLRQFLPVPLWGEIPYLDYSPDRDSAARLAQERLLPALEWCARMMHEAEKDES
ncbi:MAG: dethiobiotin synthase [Moorellales bacterium]